MAKPASALRKPREQRPETPQSEAHHLNDSKTVQAFDKDKKWDTEDRSDAFKRRRMDSLTEHLGCTSYYAKMRWTWFGHSPYGLFLPFDVSRFYHEKKLALDIGINQTSHIAELKKNLCAENGIKYYVISSALDLKNFAELNI